MRGATNHLTAGERVAYYRKRRGMTQETLAGLVGRTVSWVEKIESGRASLDRVSTLAQVAGVLDISLYDLLPDDIAPVSEETRHHSVPTLREQLLSYRFVNPRYLAAQPTPVSITALRTSVAGVWDAYQRSRFSYVIADLQRLLPIAHATVSANTGRARAAAEVQMAYLYQAAASILPKLGEQDLAMICADNGDRLVQGSRDLAARVSVQRTIAHALHSNAQYSDALAVINQTISTVSTSQSANPELLSAVGTIHLVGAMASARTGDRQAALSHLNHARTAANQLGQDGNYLWTAFGPTNVRIHEVSVAAELGDYQRATTLGTSVDVSGMPIERQVRHHLEMARAHYFQRHHSEALNLVVTAERLAPDQVHRHFLTHNLVHAWIRSSRVAPTPELNRLAKATGIIAR
jgi:transcriptional regulator with XRE-family HTH domain